MDSVQDHLHNDVYRQSFVYTAEVVYASVSRTCVQMARQGNTNRITLMVFVEKHNLRISKHLKLTAKTPRLLGFYQ